MSDDDGGILGEIIEQGTNAIQQSGQQIKQVPGGLVKGVAGQVTVKGSDVQAVSSDDAKEKAETKEFVKELYGPSDPQKDAIKKDEKTPELTDEQKLDKLKQELHSKYYQETFNPQKQEEERPAEKVEREEMEDLQAEQKKEAEKPDFAMQKARQRVEKNPGASG